MGHTFSINSSKNLLPFQIGDWKFVFTFYMSASYINHPGSVAFFEVEEHGWFMEMCQQSHVLDLVKLRRVHGANVIQMHCNNLRFKSSKLYDKQKQMFFKKHSNLHDCFTTSDMNATPTFPVSASTVALELSWLMIFPLTYSCFGSGTNTAVLASKGMFWAAILSRSDLRRYGAAAPNISISASLILLICLVRINKHSQKPLQKTQMLWRF